MYATILVQVLNCFTLRQMKEEDLSPLSGNHLRHSGERKKLPEEILESEAGRESGFPLWPNDSNLHIRESQILSVTQLPILRAKVKL